MFNTYQLSSDTVQVVKTSLPFHSSMWSVLYTQRTTRCRLLTPHPSQTSTLPPNTFLVLTKQSKCKNQPERYACPSRVVLLTSKIGPSMDKHTLRKDVCIEMPHSGKGLPRWRSEEGGLDLVESLRGTASTKVLAQGTWDRRSKVVDQWLRTKTIRKRLYAD
jgi:hypothetical protein